MLGYVWSMQSRFRSRDPVAKLRPSIHRRQSALPSCHQRQKANESNAQLQSGKQSTQSVDHNDVLPVITIHQIDALVLWSVPTWADCKSWRCTTTCVPIHASCVRPAAEQSQVNISLPNREHLNDTHVAEFYWLDISTHQRRVTHYCTRYRKLFTVTNLNAHFL